MQYAKSKPQDVINAKTDTSHTDIKLAVLSKHPLKHDFLAKTMQYIRGRAYGDERLSYTPMNLSFVQWSDSGTSSIKLTTQASTPYSYWRTQFEHCCILTKARDIQTNSKEHILSFHYIWYTRITVLYAQGGFFADMSYYHQGTLDFNTVCKHHSHTNNGSVGTDTIPLNFILTVPLNTTITGHILASLLYFRGPYNPGTYIPCVLHILYICCTI